MPLSRLTMASAAARSLKAPTWMVSRASGVAAGGFWGLAGAGVAVGVVLGAGVGFGGATGFGVDRGVAFSCAFAGLGARAGSVVFGGGGKGVGFVPGAWAVAGRGLPRGVGAGALARPSTLSPWRV